jgi:hypothetical protein
MAKLKGEKIMDDKEFILRVKEVIGQYEEGLICPDEAVSSISYIVVQKASQ